MIQSGNLTLQSYIKVYDDVFTAQECEELITSFETGEQEFIDEDKCPQFHQVTLDSELSTQVVHKLIPRIQDYVDTIDLADYMFPTKYSYEMVRIKKYRVDHGDQFSDHVDVNDYESSRRFLSFIVYLNDVEEGGETYFTQLRKKVRPKCGRLVIFPPLWMFPHRGNETISNTKYILSTYLHYV